MATSTSNSSKKISIANICYELYVHCRVNSLCVCKSPSSDRSFWNDMLHCTVHAQSESIESGLKLIFTPFRFARQSTRYGILDFIGWDDGR